MNEIIHIRTPSTLKEEFDRLAQKEGKKLSPFLLDALKKSLLGQNENDPTENGPWLYRRGLQALAHDQVAATHREFVNKLTDAIHERADNKAGNERSEIVFTLPRALAVGLGTERSVQTIKPLGAALTKALDTPDVTIRAAFIDQVYTTPEQLELRHKLRGLDREFYYTLLGAGRERVTPKFLTLDDVVPSPFPQSDRVRLNQFVVFGDIAVVFTAETSCGLPFRFFSSTASSDIGFWREQFEEIWNSGQGTSQNVWLSKDDDPGGFNAKGGKFT
jgi:hypothetical protein